jgi:hypothetical protein
LIAARIECQPIDAVKGGFCHERREDFGLLYLWCDPSQTTNLLSKIDGRDGWLSTYGSCKGGTMRFAVILILFVLLFPTVGITQETPHLTFVSEYIRELAANEGARELSEQEVNSEKDANPRLMASIRGSTISSNSTRKSAC